MRLACIVGKIEDYKLALRLRVAGAAFEKVTAFHDAGQSTGPGTPIVSARLCSILHFEGEMHNKTQANQKTSSAETRTYKKPEDIIILIKLN